MIPGAEPDAVQFVSTQAISMYEGVVPRPNDYWGAQIFVRHRRIYLGTFSSEIAAARARDSASLKFHGDNFFRSFLLTKVTIHEPLFQDHFSREVVLDMIRNRSYEYKLFEFVRMFFEVSGILTLPDAPDSYDGAFVKKLFHIELTSSDVEPPQKLMLPNERVIEHFGHVSETEHQILYFHDRTQRIWAFQYCYSSRVQRYILALGWDDFVDEMELHANDIIVFYRCREWRNFPPRSFYMIDTIHGFRSRSAVQEDIQLEESVSSV